MLVSIHRKGMVVHMMVTKSLRGHEEPMFVGTTLATAHFYHGDDVSSDGCYYWDESKGEIGCSTVDDMFRPEVTVDASPEMQEKARLWLREKVKAYIPGLVESHSHDRAQTITKGDTVRVVKGRKIPKGTVGKVFWKGETRFGWSVGVALSDRKDASGKYADVAFTSPSNLEVVNAPTYALTDAQVEEICDSCATLGCYPTMYRNVEYSVKHALGIYPDRY